MPRMFGVQVLPKQVILLTRNEHENSIPVLDIEGRISGLSITSCMYCCCFAILTILQVCWCSLLLGSMPSICLDDGEMFATHICDRNLQFSLLWHVTH